MKAALALALAACTTSSPSETTLPNDAYYFQPVGYVCEPSASADCRFELAFCTDGTYQYWAGDIEGGTYELEDADAVTTSGFAFDFDFTSQQMKVAANGLSLPYFATDTVYAVSCP